MAAARSNDTMLEPDRIGDFPHPRETLSLLGHEAALARAARAIRGGRPPQAWLITGPPGIGKATMAYRIARYLLRHGAGDTGPDDLAVTATDPVQQQIASGAHPGLLVIRRGVNLRTGKLMNVISVEEVRKLSSFFGMTSGAGGWRVTIVDTADEMNDAAANALLKTLEEPPERGQLLLIANNPGRLPSTIRSRCQRMDLRPLPLTTVEHALTEMGIAPAEAEKLAQLSGGAIGMALLLAQGEGPKLAEEAAHLIAERGAPDVARLLALGERLARITDGVETFGAFLAEQLGARIRERARAGHVPSRAWLEAADELQRKFARTAALYMEPRQTVISAATALAETQRRAGLL